MRGGLIFEDKGEEEGDPPLWFVGRENFKVKGTASGFNSTRVGYVGLHPCGEACMSQ